MAYLIRLSKRRLDEVFKYVNTPHQLSVLFDEIIKAPTFASYLPGVWHTLDQQLTGEEIETEVAWLHKNMTPSQRTRIATLKASDLDKPIQFT